MMDVVQKKILNSLLDKYEKSKSFTGDNKVRQSFCLTVKSLFPEYEDQSDFETFQKVNEAIDFLVKQQLITATINRARVCSKVCLVEENLEAIYIYLNRLSKRAVNQSLLQLLEAYADRNPVLKCFCQEQAQRIQSNKPVSFFNDDISDFENLLRALDEVMKIEKETFIRDFSVRVFRDSKVFERLSQRVIGILFEYGDFPEKEQVLSELNLIKNPTYVNCKGAAVIELAGQALDLNRLTGDLAISSAMLADVNQITITGKSVMTIENLTSFHRVNQPDTLMIYLGGFHNQIRRDFVRKIADHNPEVSFFHFGDIDAGGFYIFEHLRQQTGVDFKPYHMDRETLLQYRRYTKKLTENDRKRLKKLVCGRFKDVIDYMLEHDCKLEQEAID